MDTDHEPLVNHHQPHHLWLTRQEECSDGRYPCSTGISQPAVLGKLNDGDVHPVISFRVHLEHCSDDPNARQPDPGSVMREVAKISRRYENGLEIFFPPLRPIRYRVSPVVVRVRISCLDLENSACWARPSRKIGLGQLFRKIGTWRARKGFQAEKKQLPPGLDLINSFRILDDQRWHCSIVWCDAVTL
jgi:hypothetical protein